MGLGLGLADPNPDLFEFQKRMVRSAVPPPDARRLRCHGHQAIALTAAWVGRVRVGVRVTGDRLDRRLGRVRVRG